MDIIYVRDLTKKQCPKCGCQLFVMRERKHTRRYYKCTIGCDRCFDMKLKEIVE
jgi:hypothetical protein